MQILNWISIWVIETWETRFCKIGIWETWLLP